MKTAVIALIMLALLTGCNQTELANTTTEVEQNISHSNESKASAQALNNTNNVTSNNESSYIKYPNASSSTSYDWNVHFYCEGCRSAPICFDESKLSRSKILQLQNAKDKLLNTLPKGEAVFAGYRIIHPPNNESLSMYLPTSGCVMSYSLNMTDNAYKILDSLDLSQYMATTIFMNPIIPWDKQEVPLNNDTLDWCFEDRDCIMVDATCCAQANCGYKAVNKAYVKYWGEEFNKTRSCSDMCAAVMCHKGSAVVACENNQCIIRWSNE